MIRRDWEERRGKARKRVLSPGRMCSWRKMRVSLYFLVFLFTFYICTLWIVGCVTRGVGFSRIKSFGLLLWCNCPCRYLSICDWIRSCLALYQTLGLSSQWDFNIWWLVGAPNGLSTDLPLLGPTQPWGLSCQTRAASILGKTWRQSLLSSPVLARHYS